MTILQTHDVCPPLKTLINAVCAHLLPKIRHKDELPRSCISLCCLAHRQSANTEVRYVMLYQFLTTHRDKLIERCLAKSALRSQTDLDAEAEKTRFGVPLFLNQLIKTLEIEQTSTPGASLGVSGAALGFSQQSEIGQSATCHGRELSQLGYTVEQVVHEYGDLCQAITDMAHELAEPISADEFRTFNRCLDNGIADAVTEFTRQRRLVNDGRERQALNQRLGLLAHELRDHLNSVTHAVSAIKSGQVGFGGATGKVLDRSLIGLRATLDKSMADVRLTAGADANQQVVLIADLVAEIADSFQLEAQVQKCQFSASVRGTGLAVMVDRHLLLSALGNLLQNAFKFTKPETKVTLTVYADGDQIRMDVQDQSGGLPDGKIEDLFVPFTQKGENKSGLGLGLSICQRSVEANHGTLSARNLPGSGSIFSISLPNYNINE